MREVGCAIIGQTGDLVPADKKLYALRDVTATVDQRSLIASSIMSKKLAAGADAIVLDVKVGDGAFMKTLDEARELARTMIEIGRGAGREVVCELTDMDQPLGRAVGNAIEVREALDTVRGQGPPDFTELVLASCAHLLALSDLDVDYAEGRRLAEEAVADGSALAAYERWIRAQGGDPDESALERAPIVREVPSPRAGVVVRAAQSRSGARLSASEQAGRPRTIASTTPSASSASPSAATASRRGSRSPRSMPATRARPSGPSRRSGGLRLRRGLRRDSPDRHRDADVVRLTGRRSPQG